MWKGCGARRAAFLWLGTPSGEQAQGGGPRGRGGVGAAAGRAPRTSGPRGVPAAALAGSGFPGEAAARAASVPVAVATSEAGWPLPAAAAAAAERRGEEREGREMGEREGAKVRKGEKGRVKTHYRQGRWLQNPAVFLDLFARSQKPRFSQ